MCEVVEKVCELTEPESQYPLYKNPLSQESISSTVNSLDIGYLSEGKEDDFSDLEKKRCIECVCYHVGTPLTKIAACEGERDVHFTWFSCIEKTVNNGMQLTCLSSDECGASIRMNKYAKVLGKIP